MERRAQDGDPDAERALRALRELEAVQAPPAAEALDPRALRLALSTARLAVMDAIESDTEAEDWATRLLKAGDRFLAARERGGEAPPPGGEAPTPESAPAPDPVSFEDRILAFRLGQRREDMPARWPIRKLAEALGEKPSTVSDRLRRALARDLGVSMKAKASDLRAALSLDGRRNLSTLGSIAAQRFRGGHRAPATGPKAPGDGRAVPRRRGPCRGRAMGAAQPPG